ncbi:hypothetical protein [Aureimonas sp. SK2]|uniref:hypothetical protein n=1 Tax=Aureimonas sp. SK2 TaxID=3015992 RepID=UPI0024440ABA|nr:hypothetical protein [Aureimonas sp. SK2]
MPLTVAALGFIALQINAAIDNRELEDISIDTVRREIEAGTILAFLRRGIRDMDLTHLTAETEAELLAEWQEIDAAVNAGRKFGVEHRGLTLLVAFLIEGMQRRARRAA